jgi:signal transduction histidine kinase
MAPESIPIALSPFGQIDSSLARKYGGAGLGLPIARRFAILLGGRLDIASDAGAGTTVTVTLPARPGDGTAAGRCPTTCRPSTTSASPRRHRPSPA